MTSKDTDGIWAPSWRGRSDRGAHGAGTEPGRGCCSPGVRGVMLLCLLRQPGLAVPRSLFGNLGLKQREGRFGIRD